MTADPKGPKTKRESPSPQPTEGQMLLAGFEPPAAEPVSTGGVVRGGDRGLETSPVASNDSSKAAQRPAPKPSSDREAWLKHVLTGIDRGGSLSMADPQSDSEMGSTESESAIEVDSKSGTQIRPDALPEVLKQEIEPPRHEAMPELADKLVVILDAHSLIYQVFHALPPMTSQAGLPVAAVYGIVGDVLELMQRKEPDYLIAAFDKSEITFRNELYGEYKANRDSMPDELRQQIPLIRLTLDAMGIGIMEQAGFEADDLLATVSKQVDEAGGRCLVVTSDKDCRQLITDRVHIYNLRKDDEIDAAKLWDLWGVRPDQVVDYQALVGDPVDNVPGIHLIGPKLAQQLLEEFDNLDAVLDNAGSVSGAKRRQNLLEGREKAALSRQLVALRTDVETPIPWSRSLRSAANVDRVDALLQEFGFRRLRGRVAEVYGNTTAMQEEEVTPSWKTDYQIIDTQDKLQRLVTQLSSCEQIALDTETTSTHPRECELVGISVAWGVGQAAYLPVRAPAGEATLAIGEVVESLRAVLEDPSIGKVGHNLKFDVVVLRGCGVYVAGLAMDTMVADYLLNPGGRNHTLDDLAKRRLNHTNTSIKELIGTGKKQLRMDQVSVREVGPYACEDVDVPFRLEPMLRGELEEAGLDGLFDCVEMPLIEVLAEMEFNGIHVDADTLSAMSERFEDEITSLRTQICEDADVDFNVDSPKQLSKVLFEDLGLPVIKRTKTGISTDADVLAQLAVDHEIASKVLRYRQATKLKNTYIDALPTLICVKTDRVHTSFRQDVAATGRLSSTEPNLQNIPIRTEQGRAIRGAFRARATMGPQAPKPSGSPKSNGAGQGDWLLLGADYSQIELRVLAHYSGDPALLAAYQDDADIHRRVAAEVNGIEESEVTSELRRIAKTINFGIVYGQSAFGLAKTLSIRKDEAASYIRQYFERYNGVEAFMLDTLVRCRWNGYVSTILGRRRDVQGVRDFTKIAPEKRQNLTEAERIAINTPIQGSAADLIKLAMLRVDEELQRSDLRARLLLQIHDELLLETPAEEVDALEALVRNCMTDVMTLDVPLKVDVAVGKTWAEC
ncbi:MAG: DNA polymerase I [Planctomycetota bacterium]